MSSDHGHSHPETDIACAMAHGDVPAPTQGRRLVAVFASPVALQLVHLAAHVGFDCLVVDPERDLEGARTVRTAEQAALDGRTDVVVTDHDRPELGDVLAEVLEHETRWVGVMGSPRHTAPHVAALAERGVAPEVVARVHRPIGLDIGSKSPAEIAVSTVAGLLADRNGRAGGVYTA
ncbi:MAG: Xanthine and CO dehydrogenases maturation factor, XdhC/CoxF family [uncultured Frankineae bacterium]|uniref:Xanthine and CO dehydrogenases maturation factor, XdhC/CoxF family n=1 Tax=uncultured Frankineae bacterium TaxID=437475 RepID=A0A6J4LXG7_9ACTN|nr:MAG: Xanthine and CO dehydrogenases maturation factor, XdhC/CoxF family [uncultured Frankineae bacterium]